MHKFLMVKRESHMGYPIYIPLDEDQEYVFSHFSRNQSWVAYWDFPRLISVANFHDYSVVEPIQYEENIYKMFKVVRSNENGFEVKEFQGQIIREEGYYGKPKWIEIE